MLPPGAAFTLTFIPAVLPLRPLLRCALYKYSNVPALDSWWSAIGDGWSSSPAKAPKYIADWGLISTIAHELAEHVTDPDPWCGTGHNKQAGAGDQSPTGCAASPASACVQEKLIETLTRGRPPGRMPGGYGDPHAGEVGDMCNSNYGSVIVSDAGFYNLVANGRKCAAGAAPLFAMVLGSGWSG